MKATALILLSLITFILSTSAHANGSHVQGIVSLPYPMMVVMKNKDKLNLIDSQLRQIETDVMGVFPKKIHAQMNQVKNLERKLQATILKDQQSLKQLEEQLKHLTELKLQLTRTHISALNKLGSILNAKQWQQLQKILKHPH